MKLKSYTKFLSNKIKLFFKPKTVQPIYEIHITVDISKERFLKEYKTWKYKAICVDLFNGETHTMFNLITKNKKDLKTLESYIKNDLKLNILRSKIESNIPSKNDCYGEVHIEIDSTFLKDYDEEVLYKYYPSQNILKPGVVMLTSRFNNKGQLSLIKDDFKTLQYLQYTKSNSKLIVEHCIYDTNKNLDNTWIK